MNIISGSRSQSNYFWSIMNESLLGLLLPDAEKGFEIKTHCNGRQCMVCLWHFVMQTWKNKTANHLFQSCLQSMSLHRSTPLPWWRRLPQVHQELSNMIPCLSFSFHISSKHIDILHRNVYWENDFWVCVKVCSRISYNHKDIYIGLPSMLLNEVLSII